VQRNAVQVVELFLGASPEAFKQRRLDLDQWAQAQIDWLHETFGEGNVLEAVLHMDETTPHVHAMVFPQIMRVERRGGNRRGEDAAAAGAREAPERPARPVLSASHWLDGGKRMTALQTGYASAMKRFGLQRGQERSRAKHESVQRFYGNLRRIEQAAAIREDAVSRAIERLPEPRLFSTTAQRDKQQRRQRELADLATKLSRIAKAREQQALDLRRRYEALQGRYEGLQALVGGAEAVQALTELRALTERQAAERAELQRALAELRAERDSAVRDRETLRSEMQADIEHWRAHAGALNDKIEEVRAWGRGWRQHARSLEDELGIQDEPTDGPSLR
jgi:hypothetical protein